MVLPPSPAPPGGTVTGFADIATSAGSTSGPSFRDRVDARKRGNHEDDEARKGKKPSARPSPRDHEKPLGLVARADGSLMIPAGSGAMPFGLSGIGHSGPRCTTEREAPKPTIAAPPHHAIALTDVRVGSAPGETQVHTRLAAGPHAGLELRAIERNGRVAIELIAGSGAQARALRAEMGEIREVLAARGLDEVTVDVRSGDQERRERECAAFESSGESHADDAHRAVSIGTVTVQQDDEWIL